MGLFSRSYKDENTKPRKKRFWKKRWFRVLAVILFLLVATGGYAMYRTGTTLSKISTKDGFIKSLWKSIPGVGSDQLQGENEGQINVLLLGMRGNNMPGGGLLADTIMIAMVRPKENKVALVSIPRDLWVNYPGTSNQGKINSVHALYEEKGEGKGMDAMKQIVGDITGLPIHYAVTLDFKGFTELIDAVGGVDVYLDKPFSEPTQFEGESAANFSLPAGKNHIDGAKGLFFVRARYASSDFERAKRQQQVLIALKDKLMSLGTLTDFGKVNNILNVLGDDVRTDMDISEMKKFFNLANSMQNPQIKQKVFDTSEGGLLYSTKADTPEGKTYVLLPNGGNYDKIREACRNIFQ
ncbi:MAG: LCP family protein [Candidatus Moranbacteria bacterium]|nr:LCP family protein [Candidatus Moranbacteria bacterium]